MNALPGVLMLGLASGIMSYIISEALIFKPIREFIKVKSTFICNLVHCGLCVGCWISFILEIIYRPNLFNAIPVIDHILTSFIISLISALVWLSLCLLMKLAGK
jgi:hypothetical protein